MGYIVNCKERAINSLDHKWGESAILVLIYLLIGGTVSCGTGLLMPTTSEITSSLTSNIFSLLLIPMSWGVTITFLEVSRGMKVNYGNLTKGYHDFTHLPDNTPQRYLYLIMVFVAYHTRHRQELLLCHDRICPCRPS